MNILLILLGCAVSSRAGDLVIASDTIIDTLLSVPAGSTCTVRPGVSIRFSGYGRIEVKGTMVAEGGATAPIVFSTVNRPLGSEAKPSWRGMEISGPAAAGRFMHCRFEGAFRNLVWDASPAFDSCEFRGNYCALYCAKQARPAIRNCLFSHNTYAITSDLAAPMLLDNTITGNAVGVRLQLSSQSIIGRNTISGNVTDIKSEQALGANKGSLSLHYLWNLMNQLY